MKLRELFKRVAGQRFLVIALIAGFVTISFATAHGQMGIVDCVEPRTIPVASIQGQVFDPSGVPIPDGSVSLLKDKTVVIATKTDKEGKFQIHSSLGSFEVKADFQNGFQAAVFPVRVTRLASMKPLQIILGLPGSDCPWATTSKKEFRRIIRDNNKRLQESVKNNATQK